MPQRLAYINIGSNLGDRYGNIVRAIAGIMDRTGTVAGVRCSAVIESEPWGFGSDNAFLNIGMLMPTTLEPLELFGLLQGVERSICDAPHRNASGAYVDRIIDIDLITLGDVVMDSPELTLPHPHMREREFVMEPLRRLMSSECKKTNLDS